MDAGAIGASLVCPITHELMDDPVSVPCCGNCYSKAALLQAVAAADRCPMCRAHLSASNVQGLPMNRIVQDLVARARAAERAPAEPAEQPPSTHCTLTATSVHKTGRRAVTKVVLSASSLQRTADRRLILLVLDVSGSMQPAVDQLSQSVRQVFAMASGVAGVEMSVIVYNNSWRSVDNPRSCQLQAGGGTLFMQAFLGIQQQLNHFEASCSSASVLFLTDGAPTDVNPTTGKAETADNLCARLSGVVSSWSKPVTVHCVGFTAQHNFELLDRLRKVGASEGMYQYADPACNSDVLYQKISSIAAPIIFSGNEITAELQWLPDGDKHTVKLSNGTGTMWLSVPVVASRCQVTVSGNAPVEVDVVQESVATDDAWTEYMSVAVDKLTEDVLELQSQQATGAVVPDDAELFGLALQRRGFSILKDLQSTSVDGSERKVDTAPVVQRAEKALAAIQLLLEGKTESVSRATLMDLRFQSQVGSAAAAGAPAPKRHAPPASVNASQQKVVVRKQVVSLDTYHLYQFNSRDRLCSNAFHGKIFASDCVSLSATDANRCDADGHSAMFYAAVHGFWLSYEHLRNAGGVWLPAEAQLAFNTCVSYNFTKTAALVLKHAAEDGCHVRVTRDHQYLSSSIHVQLWLKTLTDSSVEEVLATVIEHGMVDRLQELIRSGAVTRDLVSFADFAPFVANPKTCSPNHLKMLGLLLDARLLNPDEEWFDTKSSGPMTALLALLPNSVAVQTLLSYMPNVDAKTGTNGITALWYACLRGYADSVVGLVEAGADVNATSKEGDPPIIPACRMGHYNIVKTLLTLGADATLHNPERDNAVLICCRNGHADVLQLVLAATTKRRPDFLVNYAAVDGFGPVISAAELDRDECLRVLARAGADLEQRSADCSGSIVGATAAHVAARFGKVKALRALAELGANMNAVTRPGGMTPLHLAVKFGHADAVRLLMSLGSVNTNITDDSGHTAAMYSRAAGREGILAEFFASPLDDALLRLFSRDPAGAMTILRTYGTTAGCCELDQVLSSVNCGFAGSLLALAVLREDVTLQVYLESTGCSWDQKDARGLTPAFWKAMMDGSVPASPDMERAVAHVRATAATSVQSRLLLDLAPPRVFDAQAFKSSTPVGQPVLPVIANSGGGWALPASTKVMLLAACSGGAWPELKSVMGSLLVEEDWKDAEAAHMLAVRREYPMVTFLGKLAKSVCDTNGITEAQLQQLVWEAKVHTVGIVATTPECPLNMAQIAALFLYAWLPQVQQGVNGVMSRWEPGSHWASFTLCLYRAVTALPPFVGECFVSVPGALSCSMGDVLTCETLSMVFSDWSRVWVESPESYVVAFILNMRFGGRDISKYTRTPQDHQVMLLPGTRFAVTAMYKYDVVVFGQANIRAHSYTASESDVCKAQEGKRSIVVELTEL